MKQLKVKFSGVISFIIAIWQTECDCSDALGSLNESGFRAHMHNAYISRAVKSWGSYPMRNWQAHKDALPDYTGISVALTEICELHEK